MINPQMYPIIQPGINSFIESRRFSNMPFMYGHPQVNSSWQVQKQEYRLKDFLTTSSNLLERKKNRLKSNKDWILRSQPFKGKNMNFYPNGKPYFEKSARAHRIYAKPQSAKRPVNYMENNWSNYRDKFSNNQYNTFVSRNQKEYIEEQKSNPVKANP